MSLNQKVLTEPNFKVRGEARLHRVDGGAGDNTRGRSEMLLKIPSNLMEEILDRGNLRAAHETVVKNKGCPGIDGVSTEQLYDRLVAQWPELKRQLLAGEYCPKPVKRVEIPKADGGIRMLGIPTVQDRFIQQAVSQVLQRYIDPTFSEHSYGFRPNRSAIEAIKESKSYVESGYEVVVDIDLEKFFDRVNHDKLMSELYKRMDDSKVLKLIRSYLDAGAVCDGLFAETKEGTPQGGPLSPLLSNVMLDLLDKELEKRGHKFVRYADDCNIYVRTKKAGERVMESISDFITRKLKLKVNKKKSGVGKPSERKFLGFVILSNVKQGVKIGISHESRERVKKKIREITRMTRGISIEMMTAGLKRYLDGWRAYYGHAETPSVFGQIDGWIRRRLRCYLLQQWGRGRGTYRSLKALGLSNVEARTIAWSHKGPWRLSRTRQIHSTVGNKVLEAMGFKPLSRR